MKKKVGWMILAGILLGALIAQAGSAWPTLTGVWRGYFTIANGDGYAGTNGKLVIKDQQGPMFRGYFTHADEPANTNWISGSLQSSLVLPGGFDVSFAMTDNEGSAVVGSALLVTSSLPFKLMRVELRVYNNDTGIQGHTMARGTLTKK